MHTSIYFHLFRNPNSPKVEHLPVWPKYEHSSQFYMELNAPSVVKTYMKEDVTKFWLETVSVMARNPSQYDKDEL